MTSVNEIKVYYNLINGELVPSSTNETIDSYNPATGNVWAKIPKSTKDDVEKAVASARNAFSKWSALTPTERMDFLRRVGDHISNYAEELAFLETMDTGWIIRDTQYGLIPVLKQLWYDAASSCSIASRGQTVPLGATSYGYTMREPLGVVLGIIPWNSPLFTFTIKAAYALAGGNTVIIKSSEYASVSVLRYGELLSEILPPGVLNIVSGYGSELGPLLVGHRGINKISLTGSVSTARAIVESTVQHPKPFVFELGGKSPNIVFEDADLDKAAEGVTLYSIFTGNAGQLCVGGSRILIQRSVFEEMVARIKHVMTQYIHLGDPLNPETTMGPIGNEAQYNKVRSYIDVGLKEGEILVGGRYGGEVLLPDQPSLHKGYWVEPTLIKVESNECRICQEEIFGPVATVMPFDTEEEAVTIANGTSYGLAAGVWTTNLARAQRMLRLLEAGNVWVNTYARVGPELPFGGFKESGFGTDSIMEFTREKSCVIEIG